jgi:integrase
MAIVSVGLGLRWSELAGLRWLDVEWLGGELNLRRAVVMQITGEVKTVHSAKPLPLDARSAGSAESTQTAERVYSGNRFGVRLT